MDNYNKDIKSTPVVMVEFYASWCPHCQRMMPVVAEAKKELEGKVNVFQFDIDKESALAEKLNVQTIPTFIIYKNGEEVYRNSGETTLEKLLELVKKQE